MLAINHQSAFSRVALRCGLVGVLTVAVTFVVFTGTISAQQYDTLQPKMQAKAAKQLASKVSAAMRNAATFQADGRDNIDRYFNTYYFPKMTQTNPGSLAELGDYREKLIKLVRGSSVPAAQQHLTSVTRTATRALSRGNYHPAVRYNSVLVLGMLDQEYASSGGNATPPVVLPEATNDLLELLEQNEFKGVKVHPSVKVGALEGLERHIRFGLDAQYADRVTKVALAVLEQEPSALGVDADVNHWIQCQAARVLARQFAAGPDAAVHTALTKLIANEEMSLEDRCCVVGLLEKITYTAAGGADAAATVVPLGKLTKAVVAKGAEEAREFIDLELGANPGTIRRRSFGNRRGNEGPKLERRRLLARLTMIDKGAKSLSDGLVDEQKVKVQSLTELLSPVMEISKDRKSLDLDVAGDVIKLEDSIDNMIASWQPAATAEEAADDEFVE